MNKFQRLIYILVILCAAVFMSAQEVSIPVQDTNADSVQIETKPLDSILIQPVQHAFLPRRQTIISLQKFDEEIKLDKIIKQSNRMLYEVKK